MTQEKNNILLKYSDWIFKGIVLVAIIANLWLNDNFVGKPEFAKAIGTIELRNEMFVKENSSQHLMIQTTISDMAVAVKLLAASTLRLEDHEVRLRIVEARQINILSRVEMVEKHIVK